MSKSKNLVIKSNTLVEARYKFTIWETRVFAKMVTMINQEDKEFKTYRIDIKDLMSFYGTKAHNDYDRIRAVPEALLKKVIRLPYINDKGEKRLFKTSLISGSDEPNDPTLKNSNTTLELTFHPNLKPHLLGLKEKFSTYDIRNTLRISSSNSIHLYELLKQYEKIKKRAFVLEELKEMLGLEEKYSRYSHFKEKILEKAKQHLIEYSDIRFNYKSESRGKGKKVTHIVFFIYPNQANKSIQTVLEHPDKVKVKGTVIVESEVTKELVDLGILRTTAANLFQQGFDIIEDKKTRDKAVKRLEGNVENYFKEKIALLKKNKSIQNPAGYVTNALKQDWLSPEVVKTKTTKEKRRAKQQFQKFIAQLESKIESLKAERSEKCFQICQSLIEKEDNWVKKIYEPARSKGGSLARQMFPPNADPLQVFNSRTLGYGILLSTFIETYPTAFEETCNEYNRKIEQLESQLDSKQSTFLLNQ